MPFRIESARTCCSAGFEEPQGLRGAGGLVRELDALEPLVALGDECLLPQHAGLAVARGTALGVDETTARDGRDEGRFRGDGGVVATGALPHVDEDLLHEVLGLAGIGEPATGQRPHQRAEAIEARLDRAHLAACDPREQELDGGNGLRHALEGSVASGADGGKTSARPRADIARHANGSRVGGRARLEAVEPSAAAHNARRDRPVAPPGFGAEPCADATPRRAALRGPRTKRLTGAPVLRTPPALECFASCRSPQLLARIPFDPCARAARMPGARAS